MANNGNKNSSQQKTVTAKVSGSENTDQESSQDYIAPEVKELGGEQMKPSTKPTGDTTTQQPKVKEATFQKPVGVIATGKMVNAKGTLATNVMVERIEKHMKHLDGKLGFATKEERQNEQVTFIETVGNSLKLDYEQFVLVTDELLNAIRNSQDVFDKGLAFRFMVGLDKIYPAEHLRSYQIYIGFLATIAKNWVGRSKLANQIDIGYVTKDFGQKAKENINQYFRQVISA